MMKGLRLLLLFFGIAGIPLMAAAQYSPRPEKVGTITGNVVDAHGKPVADASVMIQTSDGLHPHATRTDSNGRFEFARFETGQYDLRAYSNGVFSEWDRRVVIQTKRPTQITLRLPSSGN
jgi:uncharacterized GH25 family protein